MIKRRKRPRFVGGDKTGGDTVYEYKVVEIREKMIGRKMSGEKLEEIFNEHARQGWRLKAVTAGDVRGRVGPIGLGGLLITFEREN